MFAFYRICQAYDFIHISLLLSWLNIVWCSGNDYGCSKSSAIQWRDVCTEKSWRARLTKNNR